MTGILYLAVSHNDHHAPNPFAEILAYCKHEYLVYGIQQIQYTSVINVQGESLQGKIGMHISMFMVHNTLAKLK